MSNKEIPCHNCITLPICINLYREKGTSILFRRCSIVRSYITCHISHREINGYTRVNKYLLNKIERNNK